MKKALFIIGGIVLLILIVLIILPFVIDINDIVDKQIPKVEEAINRQVQIGDIKLTILTGLGARIEGVSISNHPDFLQEPFVSLDSVKIGVKLLPLLKGKVNVNDVSVVNPKILVERDPSGRFNFSDLISPTQPKDLEKEAKEAPPEKGLPPILGQIEVSKVNLKGGTIRFIDSAGGSGPREIKIDDLYLKLESVSLTRRMEIDISAAVFASPKAGEFAVSGSLGPVGTDLKIEKIPMDLVLSLKEINLKALAPYLSGINFKSGSVSSRLSAKGLMEKELETEVLVDWKDLDLSLGEEIQDGPPPTPVRLNGTWRMKANLKGTLEALQAKGKVDLDKGGLIYSDLLSKEAGVPLSLEFDVASLQAEQQIKNLTANVGSMQAVVSGSLKTATGSELPVLDIKLNSNTFSAAELVNLSPLAKKSIPAGLELPDAVSISAILAGPPENLSFNSSVDISRGSVKYGEFFNKPKGTPLSASVSGKLSKDAISVDNFKFTLADLNLSAAVRVKNFENPYIDASASIPPTDLASLGPILPPLRQYEIKGKLDLDARVKSMVNDLAALKGVDARLTIKDAGLSSAEVQKKFERIKSTVTVKNGAIFVTDTSLSVGPSSFNIDASVRNLEKPQISVKAASDYLDIDSLLPPAAPEGEKKKTEQAAAPKTEAPPQPKGEPAAAPELTLDAEVKIAKGKYQQVNFNNFQLILNYDKAIALLKRLRLDVFSGVIASSGRIDLNNMEKPAWNLRLDVAGIQAESILKAFTSMENVFYGSVTSNVSLNGRGADWPSISESLSGRGKATVRNGKLATVNLLDSLGQSLVKLPNMGALAQTVFPKQKDKLNETKFNDLSAEFTISDGKIHADNINMSAMEYSLTARGTIGLDQSLDIKATAEMSDDASAALKKDKVLRYVLNDRGRLEIPFAMRGSVTSPAVRADGDALSKMIERGAKKAAKDAIKKEIEKKLDKQVEKLFKGLGK